MARTLKKGYRPKRKNRTGRTRLVVSKEIVNYARNSALPLNQKAQYFMRDRLLDKAILRAAARFARAAGRSQIAPSDIRLACQRVGSKVGKGKKEYSKNLAFARRLAIPLSREPKEAYRILRQRKAKTVGQFMKNVGKARKKKKKPRKRRRMFT